MLFWLPTQHLQYSAIDLTWAEAAEGFNGTYVTFRFTDVGQRINLQNCGNDWEKCIGHIG
jgi:hypothetical protein